MSLSILLNTDVIRNNLRKKVKYVKLIFNAYFAINIIYRVNQKTKYANSSFHFKSIKLIN